MRKSCDFSAFCNYILYFMEVQVISNKELLINEEIRDKEIRVIGVDGEQLGIMTPRAALMLAVEKSLDLVMIAPQAAPPVCRIMDYGKFRFEQAKKDKEAKKNQHIVDIKEIRMFMKIDVNDFNTKVNHAIKFLQDGDKVKVTVRFRGREMAHTELGSVLLDRFAGACVGISSVEKTAKLEGRSMSLFLSAKPTK
jgi:translation initiation factor IF-3